jgi:hypothetical protein
MFERRSQVSAISQEIARTLVHPGWKKYRDEWDRRSIDRYLDDRTSELRDNPFSRHLGRFNAREEASYFLRKILQGFVDAFANSPYNYNKHYVHAANALADILGVPIPPATPKSRQSGDWWTAYMPQQPGPDYAWRNQPTPQVRRIEQSPGSPTGRLFGNALAPPVMQYAPTPSGTAWDAPRLPAPGGGRTVVPQAAEYRQGDWAAPEPSDQSKLIALQALMTHPSTPEHERRAAFEAYTRLMARQNEEWS